MKRVNRMWKVSIAGIALALLAVGIGSAIADSESGTDVVHFKSDGQSAYFYQYLPGSHYYYVTVTETASSTNQGTDTRSVYMTLQWVDYTTVPETFRYYYGEIPAGDFSARNGTASLTTNTANLTGYWYPAGAPDIQLDLDWASNGTYSSSQNGRTQSSQTFGGIEYRYVQNGIMEYDYADVEGTWAGQDVALTGSTTAYIQLNRNVQHTMSKD